MSLWFSRGLGVVASFLLVVVLVPLVHADTSLSVTVTPPLFQLTISPGQSWSSALKVVNSNDYDVTYYAQPMDFTAEGESGQASFQPVVNVPTDGTAETYSLAHWVHLSPDPVTVPKGRSAEIPFTVTIPPNAEPGGHYAAILVGTQPPQMKLSGPSMKISSYVSSLLFVRVEGDIQESARIREFRTESTLYQTPDAHFLLRFENLGNTHLKPEGVVTIYNMWGKKRGELLINQEQNFGNALPKSIRKFEFSWSGDNSIFDIGQYSAEVTLNFGEGKKQNISAKTYFWVVPVVPVAATLSAIVIFILLLVWFIRRYIRRALAIETNRQRQTTERTTNVSGEAALEVPQVEIMTFESLMEPIREGVIDLRRLSSPSKAIQPVIESRSPASQVPNVRDPLTIVQFIQDYKAFFLFITVLLSAGVGVYLFFAHVLIPVGEYKIQQVTTQNEEPAGR